MERRAYLVVGGDSLVGGSLFEALRRRGHNSYATTRRRDSLGRGRVYLDFEEASSFAVSENIGYAFVVAAATNYERCANDPRAAVINVELIPDCITALLRQGIFVTFISTNAVFGGERPWPLEDDPQAPAMPYAIQKHDAELRIAGYVRELGAKNHYNVVRLTKILSQATPPLPSWFEAWKKQKPVEPFSDLVFAPMSARFVGEALAVISEKRVTGHLHLSGAENVTYTDLALTLAKQIGVSENLIAPTTASEKGVNIPFKPRYSGLGMRRTTALTGILPQPLEGVVKDLFSNSDRS